MRDVLLLRTPFDNLFLRLDRFWEMAWCVVVNQLVTVCIQLKVTDSRPDRPTPLAKNHHFVKISHLSKLHKSCAKCNADKVGR